MRVWGGVEVRSCVHRVSFWKVFCTSDFFLSELNLEQVIVRSVFFLWNAEAAISFWVINHHFPEPVIACDAEATSERKGCGACSHCFSLLVDTKEEPAIRIQCNMCKDGNKQNASRKRVENKKTRECLFLAETWRWTRNCSGEPGGGGQVVQQLGREQDLLQEPEVGSTTGE